MGQVNCNWCSNWTPEEIKKYNKSCRFCKDTKQVADPKEILCNLCGECMCPIGAMNEQIPHGLYEAKITGGYDSYHLFDMTRYTFSFCEKCLRQLFMQCKIKPLIDDVDFDGITHQEYSWEEDQDMYEYKLWNDSGGAHQAYLNKKCNMEKDCPNDAIYTKLINDHFSEACCCEKHKTKNGGSVKYVKFISAILKPFL